MMKFLLLLMGHRNVAWLLVVTPVFYSLSNAIAQMFFLCLLLHNNGVFLCVGKKRTSLFWALLVFSLWFASSGSHFWSQNMTLLWFMHTTLLMSLQYVFLKANLINKKNGQILASPSFINNFAELSLLCSLFLFWSIQTLIRSHINTWCWDDIIVYDFFFLSDKIIVSTKTHIVQYWTIFHKKLTSPLFPLFLYP